MQETSIRGTICDAYELLRQERKLAWEIRCLLHNANALQLQATEAVVRARELVLQAAQAVHDGGEVPKSELDMLVGLALVLEDEATLRALLCRSKS